MKHDPDFGFCLNLVHDYRAGCPATLSPWVSIHHIGIMLDGVCLHHIAVQEVVTRRINLPLSTVPERNETSRESSRAANAERAGLLQSVGFCRRRFVLGPGLVVWCAWGLPPSPCYSALCTGSPGPPRLN